MIGKEEETIKEGRKEGLKGRNGRLRKGRKEERKEGRTEGRTEGRKEWKEGTKTIADKVS